MMVGNLLRKASLVLIMFIFLFPLTVGAQEEIQFSYASVDILPEYDRPSVLFIFHLTLKPDTQLPARIIMKVPAAAQINAVATRDNAGYLRDAPYELEMDGGWADLIITSASLNIQLEYYEALSKADSTRNITFEWTGPYATEKLVINLVVPNASQDLIIVPPAIYTGIGQDGLSQYHIQTSHLQVNQTYVVSMSYKRTTDALEIANSPITASSKPGLETPGRVTITVVLPWILGALGISLVVMGVIGFIVWQREGRGFHPQVKISKKDDQPMIYCIECGKRAKSGDTFCRSCGTRLSA